MRFGSGLCCGLRSKPDFVVPSRLTRGLKVDRPYYAKYWARFVNKCDKTRAWRDSFMHHDYPFLFIFICPDIYWSQSVFDLCPTSLLDNGQFLIETANKMGKVNELCTVFSAAITLLTLSVGNFAFAFRLEKLICALFVFSLSFLLHFHFHTIRYL